jgi:O-antigen ligase
MNHVFSKPILLRIFFAFIVFFLVSQTTQYKTIEKRTVGTFTEISQGQFEGATGGRTAMFGTALEIAKHFPFGVGTDNFRTGGTTVIILDAINNENVTVKNQTGKVLNNDDLAGDIYNYRLESYNEDGSLKYTSRFRHAHNEWLNVLAENGVAGFILLTLLFAFPIKIFWQNLSHENDLVGMYSYCGILLIVSFAIFGQTQSVFTSHAAVIFFIFFLFLFLAQISRLNNIDDNHDSIY